MKIQTFTLVPIIAATLLAGCASPDTRRTPQGRTVTDVPPVQTSAEETLYILVNSSGAGALTIDEMHLFSNAVRIVFDENRYPNDYVVRQFARNAAPENEPTLVLTLVQWGQKMPDQIDCSVSAYFREGAQREDLGVSTGAASGLSTALGPSEVNDIFQRAAVDALRRLYPDLSPHLHPSAGLGSSRPQPSGTQPRARTTQ